ncbi:hypothetical protein [Acinetobacter sp. CWB-B33]|uniref:hypothetical protein n=1 Tax=Acinetobacter sp. CWB-B33 TaxID=2815724 RepID=UPI0031FEA468
MHITDFVLKAVFSAAVLGLSTFSLAHDGHHSPVKKGTETSAMSQQMDHSQHSAQAHEQHMQMMAHMNHQQSQPAKDQQQDATEKQQEKNAQKGDQHAHH